MVYPSSGSGSIMEVEQLLHYTYIDSWEQWFLAAGCTSLGNAPNPLPRRPILHHTYFIATNAARHSHNLPHSPLLRMPSLSCFESQSFNHPHSAMANSTQGFR
ncbi:hypothetical protein VNO77_30600 [Canavalia gladiata]|uniref:Uncharacterized protein n=1 Tax=Canavalia gladiata TaxID=3824 RepID=A0AAN9Q1G0_CANGL